jgi:hypothetical protein
MEGVLAIINTLGLSEFKQKIGTAIKVKHEKKTDIEGSILDSVELI